MASIPPKCKSFGYSDVGLIRRNNEDVFLQLKEHRFFALADGMGGHNAGEIAALETVAFLSECIDKMFKQHHLGLSIEEVSKTVSEFIIRSNDRIYQLGIENSAYKGMGTTLSSMLFYQGSIICAHVGDSRIYRYRDNKLTLLTHDHTLKNKLMQQGTLEDAIKKGVRYKNVLTKAIGAFKTLSPDILITPFLPKDLYLMCSDGLSDYVTDEEISCILDPAFHLEEMAFKLINLAKTKKSCDNITVLLTQVEP